MTEIVNELDLNKWLRNKPLRWLQAIALRCALRSIPFYLDRKNYGTEKITPELVSSAIRLNLLSFAKQISLRQEVESIVIPEIDYDDHMSESPNGVANSAYQVINGSNETVSYHHMRLEDEDMQIVNAQIAAASAAEMLSGAIKTSSENKATKANTSDRDNIGTLMWKQVSLDCDFLMDSIRSPNPQLFLLGKKLWFDNEPNCSSEAWSRAKNDLQKMGMQFWVDWIERRRSGALTSFDLPKEADQKIQAKLLNPQRIYDMTKIRSQGNAEWEPGIDAVTKKIKSWIELERSLIDDLDTIDSENTSLSDLDLEPQSEVVPKFKLNKDSKISLDLSTNSELIDTGSEATDRYSELRTELESLIEQCRGSNSLGYVTNLADRLHEALGADIGSMRTSLVVQRGERIRQLVDTLENMSLNSLHEQVDEFVFNQLKATRDALNMVIGLDPVLDNLDRARLGPDSDEVLIESSDFKARIDELAEKDIIEPETTEFLEGAVELAPDMPDPENRQSRTVHLLAQNFVRYTIEIIASYPEALAWTALISGIGAWTTVGATAVITAGLAGAPVAYFLARNILANDKFWRTAVGSSPANQANFDKLLIFLEQLPFKSLRDK